MAPAVVGMALVLYVSRAAKNRRRHALVSNAKDDAVAVASLKQLEAELSEASRQPAMHDGTVVIDSSVESLPADNRIEESSVLSQTNLSENRLSREGPAMESWHLPPAVHSNTISLSESIGSLSGNTRPVGGRHVLIGAGIVIATAMIVYAAAGGMRHSKYSESRPLQKVPSQNVIALMAAPAAAPWTAATPVRAAQPSKPAAPAEGFNAPPSPTPGLDKTISESNANHAHRRRVRHRQTSLQKTRAFLRRIF